MHLTIEIPDEDIRYLIAAGLDLACRYWADAKDEGGRLVLHEKDGSGKHVLTTAAMKQGFRVMREKYPRHFANVVNIDGHDAETGDVFLQCALLGDIVYG